MNHFIDTFATLVQRADSLAIPGTRSILGIAGPPGSGKSTLAEAIVASLGERAVHVPADGFHLSNRQLTRLGRSRRKGAPDTFDASGFVVLLRRLTANHEDTVFAPEFQRDQEESIAGAISVPRSTPLVVTEGNYLLLDEPPWDDVQALLSESWYLDLDPEIRIDRLIERHVYHGKTEEDAWAWVNDSDEVNTRLVEATRHRADVFVAKLGLILPRVALPVQDWGVAAAHGDSRMQKENIAPEIPAPHEDRIQLADASLHLIRDGSHGSTLVSTPMYDRSALRPSIVHIGVGGFHRAHLAMYVDTLCRAGETAWAIVGAGVLSGDAAIAMGLAAQDHLYSLVIRETSESSVSVIGSIVDFVHAYPDPTPLIAKIAEPSTQIVSMTITEGGYPVDDYTGTYDPGSAVAGSDSTFGILARGLDLRRRRGVGPLTVVSCDNILSNGGVCRTAALGEAARIDDGLASWVSDNIAFPNSMVDRITPGTTDADREWLAAEIGIVDRWPVFTEPFTLWVLEDRFTGERPPLERLDVVVTDDVRPFETMKLRLLNAAHSLVAYLAAIAGYEHVHEALADQSLRRYVEVFLDREARPVLPPVPGYDVDSFQRRLIERFSNPAIRDQVARLCLDGTAKFPKFLLPTVRAQLEMGGSIELSALGLAGWCLYLRAGENEKGMPIEVSPDPARETAMDLAAASAEDPTAFLGLSAVFGDDLPRNARFVAAYTAAIDRLETAGVAAAIDATLANA